jgi:3-hydroxyisobutyrate dehydrogenase
VMSMVFDDAASRDTWLDNVNGAIRSLGERAIAIESSTLSLEWIKTLSATIEATGASFIDAPVAGSRPQAETGQLIFMAGGVASSIEAVTAVLSTMGGAVHHVGASGSGTLLKLAVNALFAVQVATVAELLNFLGKSGADTARALEVLRTMPVTSPVAAGSAALMLAGNFSPQAPIDLIAKDLGYALQGAREVNADLPAAELAQKLFVRAHDSGYGAENVVAVAKLFA